MNIKQILILIIVFIFSMSFFSKKVWAVNTADMTIVCAEANSKCLVTPSDSPLFNEENFVPGQTVYRSILIDNQANSDDCTLSLTTKNETQNPSNFASQLFTAIKNTIVTIYGSFDEGDAPENTKNLANLFGDKPFVNTVVNAGNTKTLTWSVKFDPDAGNEYQNAHSGFDFDIDAQCGEPPTPTPTPTPISTSSPTTSPGSSSTTSSPDSSSGSCTATVPGTAPSNFRIVSSGSNTVSLAWNAVSPATHYALIFTRQSDGASYGSANIGNVTSYTITNLPEGESYVFEVFAVNDCAPGDRATVTSGNIGGTVFAGSVTAPENRPVGGDGQVLGQQDANKLATPSSNTAQQQAEVLGDNNVPNVWWPLLAQLILGIIIMIIFDKLSVQSLLLLFTAGFSWWLHQHIGCDDTSGFLCRTYWLWDLVVLILSLPLGNMLRSLFVDE